MNLPGEVLEYCRAQGLGEIISVRPVGGGCINQGSRLETASGPTLFIKLNRSAPEQMFAREAEGLEAVSVPGGPRVPQPLLVGGDFLLLEDLQPAARCPSYWADFGRQLAAMHLQTSPRFGFQHDNFIGSTHQPNPRIANGFQFFGEHRLHFQARLAARQGLLGAGDLERVAHLAGDLQRWIPEQPASLIHGDLWSGNAMTGSSGEPAIIDPAAHYGWAEAELGMTALFGRFPEVFYQAYHEMRPLAPGWNERLPLYNLYHLLNHLNLFGSSYLTQVRSVLDRFQ